MTSITTGVRLVSMGNLSDWTPSAVHRSITQAGAQTLALLVVVLNASACSWLLDNKVERIKADGELTVLTYVSPTTYYESPEGPAGFEHDLALAFADYLDVNLRFVVADKFSDVIPLLTKKEADFAAAGLAVTEARQKRIKFTSPYQEIQQQVIYRLGSHRPTNIDGLAGRQIEVHSGTRYAERLQSLKRSYPGLNWAETTDKQTTELLQLVWEGLLEITIADSHIVSLNRQYFPELQIAFNIQEPESLAWAFPQSKDDSLYLAAVEFLESQRASGGLANLIERYYGAASKSNFINLTVYRLRIQNRLPNYQTYFEQAAKQHGIDWRLLAAMGYQESYWNPKAISPTGVRGIMMLTEDTATDVEVANRLDPVQNIHGGARYLRQMIDRLPEAITEPDRTWMALAAYNVGINHLEDARRITQDQGGDSNKWSEVKNRLPLLSQREWHVKTKYGYARGLEPVRFVNRIRTYYDVLVKIDEKEKKEQTSDALELKAPAI
jgi:membrane-bound lytic murein transglycosylase F